MGFMGPSGPFEPSRLFQGAPNEGRLMPTAGLNCFKLPETASYGIMQRCAATCVQGCLRAFLTAPYSA
eukprot:5065263-Alexandrium_andersonii.AAC.1